MSISTVTSEALQLKLRQLLPSQQGFGTDLSASDTIIPVIDLTAAAEGSDVPQMLQTALAFGSQTEFTADNNTVVLANSPGFYRIFGSTSIKVVASLPSINTNSFTMTDGATTKVVWAQNIVSGTTLTFINLLYDFNVFLGAGESVSAVSNQAGNISQGSIRQIADVNGVLVNPSGFTPQ